MNDVRIAAALLMITFAACGGGASQRDEVAKRIQELRAEQAEQEAALIHIQADIARARAELAQAELEAAASRCQARRAKVEAAREVIFSDCVAAVADYHACAARNAEGTSTKTMTGCGVGVLLSLLTAGAAAPLALGGCALGRLAGTEAEEACGPAPQCTMARDEAEQLALKEEGLDAMPMCPGTTTAEAADIPAADGDPIRE
jgi:hypothetical protein